MTRIRVAMTSGKTFGTEDGTDLFSAETLVNWCLCDADNPTTTLAEIVGRLLEARVPADQWLDICRPYDLREVRDGRN